MFLYFPYRDIQFVTTENRRNYLVSESNNHTIKFFTENVLAVDMRKTESWPNYE